MFYKIKYFLLGILKIGRKYRVSYTLIVRPLTYDSNFNRHEELITSRTKVIRARSSQHARAKVRNKKGYDVRNITVERIKRRKKY